MHTFTPVAFPAIQQAEVISQKKIEIHPEESLSYEWKNRGIKVDIPPGAISGSQPRTMYIQASLKGEYHFPDDGVLVSGVYCFSADPPVEQFDKKVTVTLQHCASVDDDDDDEDDDDTALSFYTAQDTPPYNFKRLPGGSFSESGEATIDVTHFSLFAAFGRRKSLKYTICTYYLPKQVNMYEVHITVTKNKELLVEVSLVILPQI